VNTEGRLGAVACSRHAMAARSLWKSLWTQPDALPSLKPTLRSPAPTFHITRVCSQCSDRSHDVQHISSLYSKRPSWCMLFANSFKRRSSSLVLSCRNSARLLMRSTARRLRSFEVLLPTWTGTEMGSLAGTAQIVSWLCGSSSQRSLESSLPISCQIREPPCERASLLTFRSRLPFGLLSYCAKPSRRRCTMSSQRAI